MILHPDIARWMVSLHQERLAELARLSRPRPVAAGRRHRRRRDGEEA